MRAALTITVAGVASAAVAASVLAADPETIGQYNDWSAHMVGQNDSKICYIHSEPKTSVGDYTNRGRTFVQVAHRPGDNVEGEVSVTAGYTFKPESPVELDVDGEKFTLFTQKDGAWLRDSKTDAKLVTAMKKGAKMIVRGTSSRGTDTVDTYSLMGFTAAYGAIGKACK